MALKMFYANWVIVNPNDIPVALFLLEEEAKDFLANTPGRGNCRIVKCFNAIEIQPE